MPPARRRSASSTRPAARADAQSRSMRGRMITVRDRAQKRVFLRGGGGKGRILAPSPLEGTNPSPLPAGRGDGTVNVTSLEILGPVHRAGRGNLPFAGWWSQDAPGAKVNGFTQLTFPEGSQECGGEARAEVLSGRNISLNRRKRNYCYRMSKVKTYCPVEVQRRPRRKSRPTSSSRTFWICPKRCPHC